MKLKKNQLKKEKNKSSQLELIYQPCDPGNETGIIQ
jgi:hypothetical protein